MILWMSGEIMADVSDAYRLCRKEIEAQVNKLLSLENFTSSIQEWAFVAILREEDSPDYDEIAKKTSRGKELEFRLKIPYLEFRDGSNVEKINLIINALERSVAMMGNLGVPSDDRKRISEVLRVARDNISVA